MLDAKEYAVGQYDESGMVAGMEQDFEKLLKERDWEIERLKHENERLTELLRENVYSVVHKMFNA